MAQQTNALKRLKPPLTSQSVVLNNLPTVRQEWKRGIYQAKRIGDCEAAVNFRGQYIRQVSCYTLLGGCRLPWPPSCCLDVLTPVSESQSVQEHLNATKRSIPHHQSCLPGRAHETLQCFSVPVIPSMVMGRENNNPSPLSMNSTTSKRQQSADLRETCRRNQLQDSSVSLSPLIPSLTNDLHVRSG